MLPFLNRNEELSRLTRMLNKGGQFAALYGRRRTGKSRLLREVLPQKGSVYYVGDARESSLQREALAKEISRMLDGFDSVTYPDWEALLERWWKEAPSKACLCLDEFPYLVQVSPELPSLLQKKIDTSDTNSPSIIICGSSQTMMHGLVLDGAAPLYGRASEILKIKPLQPKFIQKGIQSLDSQEALFAYMLWGGVPRYWELANKYSDQKQAFEDLVLNPLGPLYSEAERLLHEDIRDPAQSFSILSLIGTGCHRPSEIASRIGKPLASLARPLSKLIDLQLIQKDIPFGADSKSNKQVIYKITDPFMAMWYEHVLPNRSLLEQGLFKSVGKKILKNCFSRQSDIWEDLARASLPHLKLTKEVCLPGQRWWGIASDRSRIELDLVSETMDKETLVVGEAKLKITAKEIDRLMFELERKAELLPFRSSYKNVKCILFSAAPCKSSNVIDAKKVFSA